MWRRTLVLMALLSVGAGCSAPAARESSGPIAGTWRLDAARSDEPRRRGSEKRTDGRAQLRRDSPFPDSSFRGRGRPGTRLRLPQWLRIEQAPDRVRLLDSSGVVLQEIVTGAAPSNATGDDVVRGRWGEGTLTVETSGRRGQTVQSFALEDQGRDLVIRTRVARDGGRGFETRRVYRREGAS